MDTEQLKLIIDALQGAGEGAKTIAIWWLVLPAVTKLISYTLTFTGVIIFTKLAYKLINRSINNLNTNALKNVINALDLKPDDIFDYNDDVYPSRVKRILKRIEELKEDQKDG